MTCIGFYDFVLNPVFELCQGYVAEFFMKKIMCIKGVVFQGIGENSI